jgi:hypothetical protein
MSPWWHHFAADLGSPLFTHRRGAIIVDIIRCPINPMSNIICRFDLWGESGVYGPLQWRLERGMKFAIFPAIVEGQWWSTNPCYHTCHGVISFHNFHISIFPSYAGFVCCRCEAIHTLPLSSCWTPSRRISRCYKRRSPPQIIWYQRLHNNI